MTLAPEDFADQEDNELFRKIKAKEWNLVTDILYTSAETASSVDKYGNTPLHAALGYKAPDSVLLKLISMHPTACRVHGSDDWLPLHVAAMWGASPDIVESLIREYPQGLDDKGSGGIKGRTPRHFSDRFPHNKELLERSTANWISLINS